MKETIEIIKLFDEVESFEKFKEISNEKNLDYYEFFEKDKKKELEKKKAEKPTSYKLAVMLKKWILN